MISRISRQLAGKNLFINGETVTIIGWFTIQCWDLWTAHSRTAPAWRWACRKYTIVGATFLANDTVGPALIPCRHDPSFLVIDGYLLNPVNQFVNNLPRMNVGRVIFLASSAAQTLAWRRKVDRVTNDDGTEFRILTCRSTIEDLWNQHVIVSSSSNGYAVTFFSWADDPPTGKHS